MGTMAPLISNAPNMALQRTRRPRFRSGRSLRSLGSPLNAYLLGGMHIRLLALFFVLSCSATARDNPKSLAARDFDVGPLRGDMSADEVRAALGSPVSISSDPDFRDTSGLVETWYYPDLSVSFVSKDGLFGTRITGKAWATSRGLRVGDSEAKVRELYGKPEGSSDGAHDYVDHSDGTDRRLIRVEVQNSRVTSIYLGMLLD